MVRRMLVLMCVSAVVSWTAPAMAGGCKKCDEVAKSGQGYCCGKGKAYGVDLTSKELYKVLVAMDVDAASIDCPGCKAALKSGGKCDHCKVTAVNGKLYLSPVAIALAKGEPVSSEDASSWKCEECKSAFKSGGKCTHCDVGFVAGRMYKNDADYQAAVAAYKTLSIAVVTAGKCESCAIAMVTDGTCEECKVKFKNGKKEG